MRESERSEALQALAQLKPDHVWRHASEAVGSFLEPLKQVQQFVGASLKALHVKQPIEHAWVEVVNSGSHRCVEMGQWAAADQALASTPSSLFVVFGRPPRPTLIIA